MNFLLEPIFLSWWRSEAGDSKRNWSPNLVMKDGFAMKNLANFL